MLTNTRKNQGLEGRGGVDAKAGNEKDICTKKKNMKPPSSRFEAVSWAVFMLVI